MLIFTGIILFFILILQPLEILHFQDYIDLLFPSGSIALEQRNLLFILQAIMLLVVLPVYFLTFVFSWIYRADNPKAKYEPDLVDNVIAEYIWWGLPLVLTLVVAYLTYIKTHELDPYKPIVSENKEKKIQVVALQWKWLFIYPEEKIAAVNFVQFPKDTPIHFEITGDAPMNSFWIPALGGQIYAMPKMKTELYLIADEAGDFRGLSANISGEGFAGMHFIARSSSEEEFNEWVASVKENSGNLNLDEYNKLASPSKNNQAAFYLLQEEKLFDKIIMKYMHP